MNRKCSSCKKCCEGWLHGKAHDYFFYKGRPCHYIGENGCSIYKDRPEDPCKSYKCVWLVDDKIPEWMKPDLVDIILTMRTKDNYEYLEVIEAGQTINSEVLNWLIQYALNNNINLHYQVNGGWNKIGNDDFLKDIF